MILMYNITTAIVSSKDILKIIAGSGGKQEKNIDKNSEKNPVGLQMELNEDLDVTSIAET